MIREYEDQDFLEVCKLGNLIKEDFGKFVNERFEHEHILVYVEKSKVKGFVFYSVLYEVVDIMFIVVNPRYRHRGIGTKLLEALYALDGVERIMLEVKSSNEVANSFYARNGFKKVRTIENYYGGGTDAYSLERVI